MNRDQKVGAASGKLRNFIIEPFVPHTEKEEMYICIYSHRHADTILFYHLGGVDVGDVDSKAVRLDVPVGENIDEKTITLTLLDKVPAAKKAMVAKFIYNLYKLYVDLYFTYLEINPLVVTDKEIYILDLAAKLDATADFICRPQWGEIDYPPPFGRDAYPGQFSSYITYFSINLKKLLHLTLILMIIVMICVGCSVEVWFGVIFVYRGGLHRWFGFQIGGELEIDDSEQIGQDMDHGSWRWCFGYLQRHHMRIGGCQRIGKLWRIFRYAV